MYGIWNRLVKALIVTMGLSVSIGPAFGQLSYNRIVPRLDLFMGDSPQANLLEGSDRLLYGTMSDLGSGNNDGTVFRVNKDGSGYTVLWRFSGAPGDGFQPCGALAQGSDGSFYGTTYSGGLSNLGTVFKLSNTGFNTYTNSILRNFTAQSTGDGERPNAGLLLRSDGWLYGTTLGGGSSSGGTVFKMRTNG